MISKNSKISVSLLADVLSISKSIVNKWVTSGKLSSLPYTIVKGEKNLYLRDLKHFPQISAMQNSNWENELNELPVRPFSSIELFAGAGGLAIGLEKAGFEACLLNEFDRNACNTLRFNRPEWNVIEGDIKDVEFSDYRDVDFLAGGFPCQAFSYAGNKMGFEDARGTLFFEFARSIKEVRPKVFLGENVRGLLNHDSGKTIDSIKSVIKELGYTLLEPNVLKAQFFQVPQKRERLMLIGIRNDLVKYAKFKWPDPYYRVMTMKDALKKGDLYNSSVPKSSGQEYPQRKKEILSLVPQGGCWVDLPDELQREYMQKSYFLGGGKTGMARRLSWGNPSLTLTCAPAQKQTERCHPTKTRPLTVREYARIQTFPDDWTFTGSTSSQYKQIGNAVPVNLAYALGRRLVSLMNHIEAKVEQDNNALPLEVAENEKQMSLFGFG